jgi:hypothetical protein
MKVVKLYNIGPRGLYYKTFNGRNQCSKLADLSLSGGSDKSQANLMTKLITTVKSFKVRAQELILAFLWKRKGGIKTI